MDNSEVIFLYLKEKGLAITKIRLALIDAFVNSYFPFSVKDLQALLLKKHITSNKTTVYRNIQMLIKLNIIQEVIFFDKTSRYELKSRDHHHHVVCNSCGDIQDIYLKTESKLLQEISMTSNYTIDRHNLEFYGHCKQCK